MTAALLIQIALKSSVVLAAAWTVARAMRRRSAAGRHLVWALGVVATLLLPIANVMAPRWEIKLQTFGSFEAFGAFESFDRSERSGRSESERSSRSANTGFIDAVSAPTASGERLGVDARVAPEIAWSSVLIAAWLAGALMALMQFVAGVVRIAWMVSRA